MKKLGEALILTLLIMPIGLFKIRKVDHWFKMIKSNNSASRG